MFHFWNKIYVYCNPDLQAAVESFVAPLFLLANGMKIKTFKFLVLTAGFTYFKHDKFFVIIFKILKEICFEFFYYVLCEIQVGKFQQLIFWIYNIPTLDK